MRNTREISRAAIDLRPRSLTAVHQIRATGFGMTRARVGRRVWTLKRASTTTRNSEVEGGGEGDAGFAGFAALDAPDEEKFLAPLFEVGFDELHELGRDNQNHSYTHIE